MSCCGGKRQQWNHEARVQTSEPSPPLAPAPQASVLYFEYIGRTALTVRGPITGRSYRFGRPGAALAVDRRDAASLSGIPMLRRL